MDFILGAQYQTSYKGTGTRATATEYCDTYRTELKTSDTAAKLLSTKKGLTGHTKCTYLLIGKSAFGAPSFEITKATYQNFQLQWIEFDTSLMTGGAVLADTSTTPYWLGAYPSSQGPFINPLSRTGITNWT
jgi:hypothetical protein